MTDQLSLSNQLDSSHQELNEREAELALINSVQLALASHLDVQAIYNLVGDKIRDIFDSQVVMISTYDQPTETIEHRYAIERGEHIFAPGRYPIRGFRTQIVQTRKPVLVNSNVAELAARLGQHTIPGTVTPKSWLGVPMIVGDQVTGILSLQNVDREDAFDESDVRLLQTLAASMSVALENARLFDETQRLLEETERRASELHIINSVQEKLARKLDRDSIYQLVGEKLSEYFKAEDLSILVYHHDTDQISTPYQVENGIRGTQSAYNVGGKGFFGYLLQNPKPLLIDENMEEAVIKFENVYSSGKGLPKSVLYIPLITGETVQGAVVLRDMFKEHAFDETDIRLLKTLANAMSVALENARLWEQEALYRKALEREFEIGREIQAGFLPDSLPQPENWEIAASLKSAREVTGDFYDVFELADGNVGLVIADVCDKGLGAALFMTLFRSLIRAISTMEPFANAEHTGAINPGRRIENALSFTNNYIAETHGKTSMFCTIFFGILDPSSGLLTYVNGGHLPPVVINQLGIKETLKVTGPAVGLAPGMSYTIGEVVIEPGDMLFAYTDGLTDTINPDGEFFDKKELIPLLVNSQSLSSMLAEIQNRVKDYSSGATQVDDITQLALRRKASQASL
jgi:serine phosphatase RsbU (regulator of sigma subunit)